MLTISIWSEPSLRSKKLWWIYSMYLTILRTIVRPLRCRSWSWLILCFFAMVVLYRNLGSTNRCTQNRNYSASLGERACFKDETTQRVSSTVCMTCGKNFLFWEAYYSLWSARSMKSLRSKYTRKGVDGGFINNECDAQRVPVPWVTICAGRDCVFVKGCSISHISFFHILLRSLATHS